MDIAPFLMFTGQAEEALGHYVSLFEGSRIEQITRWGPGGPAPEGQVMMATVVLAGQKVMASDSPPVHAFTFTPSLSLFVACGSEEEFKRVLAGLSEGGETLMPAGDYGFSRRYAWLNDRFGVSWQVNLP